MARLTPAEVALKHANRLKAAVPEITAGIDRVTENPCEKAAAKADKMLQNITAAVQSGKWSDNLRAVPLSDWKQKFKDKGVNRIAAGIDAAKAKTESFYSQLLPHIDTLQAKVKTMPDLTLEDSINRMTTFVRGMSTFRFKKS